MNTAPHAAHGLFMDHTLTQLIRMEPVFQTEEALQVLNAILGRFPTDSVVGDAVLGAILDIENGISLEMNQAAMQDAFPDMTSTVTAFNDLGVRK
jgi:hypothetical protein